MNIKVSSNWPKHLGGGRSCWIEMILNAPAMEKWEKVKLYHNYSLTQPTRHEMTISEFLGLRPKTQLMIKEKPTDYVRLVNKEGSEQKVISVLFVTRIQEINVIVSQKNIEIYLDGNLRYSRKRLTDIDRIISISDLALKNGFMSVDSFRTYYEKGFKGYLVDFNSIGV